MISGKDFNKIIQNCRDEKIFESRVLYFKPIEVYFVKTLLCKEIMNLIDKLR